MYLNKINIVIFILYSVNISNSYAEKLIFEAGYRGGGEESAAYVPHTGAGYSGSVGFQFDTQKNSYIRALVGYVRYDYSGEATIEEPSYVWSHIPVEVIYFDKVRYLDFDFGVNFKPNVELGVGLAYHINPQIAAEAEVVGKGRQFENALGVVFSANFPALDSYFLNAKFTKIDYRTVAGGIYASGSELSGDTISLTFGRVFD